MDEESNDQFRRENDRQFAEFMGEFREWKESSVRWRADTDKRLDGLNRLADQLPRGRVQEILDFMDSIRTPRRFMVWAFRAFFIAVVGGIATACVAFMKEHLWSKINN